MNAQTDVNKKLVEVAKLQAVSQRHLVLLMSQIGVMVDKHLLSCVLSASKRSPQRSDSKCGHYARNGNQAEGIAGRSSVRIGAYFAAGVSVACTSCADRIFKC